MVKLYTSPSAIAACILTLAPAYTIADSHAARHHKRSAGHARALEFLAAKKESSTAATATKAKATNTAPAAKTTAADTTPADTTPAAATSANSASSSNSSPASSVPTGSASQVSSSASASGTLSAAPGTAVQPPSTSTPTGTSSGLIAGIVVVVVLAVIGLAAGLFIRYKRRQNDRKTYALASDYSPTAEKSSTALVDNPASPGVAATSTSLAPPMVMVSPAEAEQGAESAVGVFVVSCTFMPTLADELDVELNDNVLVWAEYDDGWCLADNLTTGATKGVVPMHCLTMKEDYRTGMQVPPPINTETPSYRPTSVMPPSPTFDENPHEEIMPNTRQSQSYGQPQTRTSMRQSVVRDTVYSDGRSSLIIPTKRVSSAMAHENYAATVAYQEQAGRRDSVQAIENTQTQELRRLSQAPRISARISGLSNFMYADAPQPTGKKTDSLDFGFGS